MDYHTKKLLGLTDEHLTFEEDWLSERKDGPVTTNVIHGKLTYTPAYCPKCDIKNEGQIIKNGSHKTKIQLLPIRSIKTELALKRTRFLCKECASTFNAQTPLVEENCYISTELKRKIAMELTRNTSRKDIAETYFVSDVTVMRIMRETAANYQPNFNYLPSVLCFDEFKSMKSCSGKMSFICMDGNTNQMLEILENRRLAFLKAHFLRYSRKARLKVKYIVMDMNAPYFQLVKAIFPRAEIVTDRFHIVQHINRTFNSLRVQRMNSYRKSDQNKYKRLKRFWKLLLKNSFNLESSNYRYNRSFKRPMTEKALVDELVTYDDLLKLAYETCQVLLYYYEQRKSNQFFEIVNSLDAQLPEWFRKKLMFFNNYKMVSLKEQTIKLRLSNASPMVTAIF